MKKTKLFTCASVSLALIGGVSAGFLCSTSPVAANGATVTVPTNETKTIYLDIDKSLNEDEEGNPIKWDYEGAILDVWSYEPVSVSRETSDNTVFFVNNDNWDEPYAYCWSNPSSNDFPGEKMTPVSGTKNVFSFNVGDNKNIIFSDNGKNQTADLTIPTSGGVVYSGGNWVDTYDKGQNTLFQPVSEVSDLLYAEIPVSNTKADFIRADKDWEFVEDVYPTVWNKVEGKQLSDKYNCLNITDWDAGTMRHYSDVADGYYLLGTMNDWTPSSDNEMKEIDGVFSIQIQLDTFDEFKAAYVSRGAAMDDYWYGYNELTGTAKSDNQFIKASGESTNILVANPGTYTPKITLDEMGSVTFDCDKVEFVKTEELLVNGKKYSLIENESQPGELMTDKPVEVKSGDVIAYYTNAKLNTANPKAVGNNNCWSNSGVTTVCLNMKSTIYVDTSNPEAITIFCDGLPTKESGKNVFGLSVNNGYVPLIENGEKSTGHEEWYAYGVSLSKDNKIKFVNTKVDLPNADVFSVTNLGELPEELSGKFTTDEGYIKYIGDENISVDLYAQFKSGEDIVYITSANEGLKDATEFATAFNSAVIDICDPSGESTDKKKLVDVWKEQNTKYKGLSDEAKAILVEVSESDSNKELAAFAHYYDYIFGKYGTELSLTNFAGRTVKIIPNHYIINKNDSTALIAIATTIGIVAASAIALVVVAKKRKEN